MLHPFPDILGGARRTLVVGDISYMPSFMGRGYAGRSVAPPGTYAGGALEPLECNGYTIDAVGFSAPYGDVLFALLGVTAPENAIHSIRIPGVNGGAPIVVGGPNYINFSHAGAPLLSSIWLWTGVSGTIVDGELEVL